jgi:hypothetical protein
LAKHTFVSHDREFISSLATRIIDIDNNKVVNFPGTLAEYEYRQKLKGVVRSKVLIPRYGPIGEVILGLGHAILTD